MNIGTYRRARSLYYSLSPKDRIGMTPAKMTTLLAKEGVITTPSQFIQ